ncbi:MAG: YiiX/YebB-like N1pC/P60 family cysteine hydrolase [Gammaproteobacteria bacterium]|nr:YiiX/YebB-like N1pC/P60 family cysteine hydrolase [Gammaproteobacteria bacterium]
MISRAIGSRLASFLSKAQPGYQRLDMIGIEDVAKVLKTGDIVLVEGNTRISIAIKYLTQSSWSHACLYIGEEEDSAEKETLLEADLRAGVRVVSLKHFEEFNLRICRPVNLIDEDRKKLLAFAKAKIGQKYDLKNVFDLVRYIIQKPPVPNRYRRAMIALGSGEPTKAICSALIAESFQSIGYPILPRREGGQGIDGEVPQFYRRHFTHFTPRDFDLSPYFEVIKPTLEKGFDYRDLRWKDISGDCKEEIR